jgi:hypothetical protein
MAWRMLPVPPLVTIPHGVASATASACNMSRVIAMISPSNRVALGHTSRCSAFTWAYSPKTSPRKS